MRAVAYKTPQPIANETALIDVDLPEPTPANAMSWWRSGQFPSIRWTPRCAPVFNRDRIN